MIAATTAIRITHLNDNIKGEPVTNSYIAQTVAEYISLKRECFCEAGGDLGEWLITDLGIKINFRTALTVDGHRYKIKITNS